MVWGKTTYVIANYLRLQKSARRTSIPSNECLIPDLSGQSWAVTNEMMTRRLAHCKVEYPASVSEPISNTKHHYHERSDIMRRRRKYNPNEKYFRHSMLFDGESRKHQLKERPLSQAQAMPEETYFDKKPPPREKVQTVEKGIKQGVTLFSARIQTSLNGGSAKYKYREGDKNTPTTRPVAVAAGTTAKIHKTILSILSHWKNIADKATTSGLLLLAIISTAVIISFKNHSLDPCRLIHFAEVDNRLSYEDCATMLQTAAGDEKATQALVFIMTLAVRMEGCFWIGTCVACWYCLLFARGNNNERYRDASSRAFVVYASVTSILCWSIEANTVGFLSYGSNPAVVTPEFRDGAKPLVFVWGLISVLLWIGCIGMHIPVINQQELLEC